MGAVGDFVGGNVCTNYMNSHTSDALEMADSMTEYADNITYKMLSNTFTPQDIAGTGPAAASQQRDTGRADERYMEFYKNHVQLPRARS